MSLAIRVLLALCLESSVAAVEDSPLPDEDTALRGRVIPPDGAQLPGDTGLEMWVVVPGVTSQHTVRVNGDGSFSFAFRPDGRVYAMCTASGFAPSFHGPMTSEAARRDTLDIRLGRGFTGQIRVRSPRGDPVARAELSVAHEATDGSRHVIGTARTDDAGIARVEHCPELPLVLELRARGWEFDVRTDVRLSSSGFFEWEPTPAVGTRGRVLGWTGEPIEGAELRLKKRSEPFSVGYGDRSGPVLATTGSDGRFLLATLRRDSSYGFIVDAEGHGAMHLERVSAGDRGIEVKLPPEVRVRGTVRGDLSLLSTRGETRRLPWADVRREKDHSTSKQRWVDVDVEGDRGTFEIRDALGTHVRVEGELHELPKDAATALEVEVVLRNAPRDTRSLRTLIVEFTVKDGDESLFGSVRIDSHAAEDPTRRRSIYEFRRPVVDGRASLDVHAPGTVRIQARRTRGFTFDDLEFGVAAGDGELHVEVEGRRAGVIEGVALEPTGESSQRSVNVSCYPVAKGSSDLHNFKIDADGRFVVTPLEFGQEYVVAASRGKVMVLSRPVRIERENPSPAIRLQLVRGVPARGRLLDSDGLPIGGVDVSASFETNVSSHSYSPGTVTSRLGFFDLGDFNPAVGTMSVRIVPTSEFQPRVAKLPKTGERIDIELERGHVLEGRIVDAESGAGIGGMTVYALPASFAERGWNDRFPAEGATDADGRFRLSTLPSVDCRLRVDGAFRFVDEAPRVTPGTDGEIVLRVRSSGTR